MHSVGQKSWSSMTISARPPEASHDQVSSGCCLPAMLAVAELWGPFFRVLWADFLLHRRRIERL